MATATITLKKGTTAEWTESKRVLDDGELGLETTTSGHRIIRIGNGSTGKNESDGHLRRLT